MLLLLETMFFYIYAESHWKYHTFDRSLLFCSCSKLRHKTSQNVRKCSLTFPLKNGIVTFYENFTNKYAIVDKLRGGGIHPQGCKSLFEVGGIFYGREAISLFSGGLMQYLAASDKFLEGL